MCLPGPGLTGGGVEAYPGGCSGARSSPGGGLHPLPGGPHRGLTGAGGEHPAPPAAGSTVGQDAAPVLPNRLGWLALGLRHHLGTPGCKGSRYPALLWDHGAVWPPVSSLGPQQPPCTPKCLGLPVAVWQLAPNAGCSALGSPPSQCRAAAGWEQPILVGPAAVGTPQQPATVAPLGCWHWVTALPWGIFLRCPPWGRAGPAPPLVQTGLWQIRALPVLPGKRCRVPRGHGRAHLAHRSRGSPVGATRAGLARVLVHMPTTSTLPCSSPQCCPCATMAWQALRDPGFLGCDIG